MTISQYVAMTLGGLPCPLTWQMANIDPLATLGSSTADHLAILSKAKEEGASAQNMTYGYPCSAPSFGVWILPAVARPTICCAGCRAEG